MSRHGVFIRRKCGGLTRQTPQKTGKLKGVPLFLTFFVLHPVTPSPFPRFTLFFSSLLYLARRSTDFFWTKTAALCPVLCPPFFTLFDSINHFFLISQMIIPGSRYWNIAFGREKGEVEKDEEGIRIMKTLGENMAWLLKRLHFRSH